VIDAAARALVGIAVNNVPLAQLCGWQAETFGTSVRRWATQLGVAKPLVTNQRAISAARHGVAASVAAYRDTGGDAGRLDRLRANLPDLLAACGPAGHLAGEPAFDVKEIAGSLTERLMATVDDGWSS